MLEVPLMKAPSPMLVRLFPRTILFLLLLLEKKALSPIVKTLLGITTFSIGLLIKALSPIVSTPLPKFKVNILLQLSLFF